MSDASARQVDALSFHASRPRKSEVRSAKPGAAPRHSGRVTAPAAVSTKARTSLTTPVTLLIATLAVAYGYSIRNTDTFVPYEGTGYYLGILGGTGMLLQLAYSAVKRLKPFRRMAASRALFNMHMLLGLAAPITILYHCNFSWGAKNSNVALIAMLLVVASGLIGRLVYRHIYFGLNGARADMHAMLDRAHQILLGIDAETGSSGGQIATKLSSLTANAAFHSRGTARQFAAILSLPFKTRLARLKFAGMIRRAVAENASRLGWSRGDQKEHRRLANEHVRDFLETFSRASQLAFWERAFALWHLFHVPLFYLLLLSGIAHVIAVHWY